MQEEIKKIRLKLLPDVLDSMTVVTGADSSHYFSLVQFIDSYQLYESLDKLVIYDLGLKVGEVSSIINRFPNIEIRKFDYNEYPKHFDIKINAGCYAWKPAIIRELLNEKRNLILWLDAGCMVNHSLMKIKKAVKYYGFYSPASSGTVDQWTHPDTMAYLKVKLDFRYKYNLSGFMLGFNSDSEFATQLLREWYNCAREKDCIAPRGSTRNNHRQDQAAITILAWKLGMKPKSPKNLSCVTPHCDIDHKYQTN